MTEADVEKFVTTQFKETEDEDEEPLKKMLLCILRKHGGIMN